MLTLVLFLMLACASLNEQTTTAATTQEALATESTSVEVAKVHDNLPVRAPDLKLISLNSRGIEGTRFENYSTFYVYDSGSNTCMLALLGIKRFALTPVDCEAIGYTQEDPRPAEDKEPSL